MKLDVFEYLRVIERFKTISRAAEQLHMSRQGLHMAIKQMEEELGVDLLKRQAKGMSLSAEGAKACEIVEECLRKLHSLKVTTEMVKGNLVISGTEIVLSNWLPKALSALHIDYPGIVLKTDISDINSVIQQYLSGHIDLGFLALSQEKINLLQKQYSTIQVMTFAQYGIGICVSKKSPLAHQKFLTRDCLKNVQLIYACTEEHAHKQSEYELFEPSNRPETIFEPIYSVYMEMIVKGLGVGVIPINAELNAYDEERYQLKDEIAFLKIQDIPEQYVGYLVDSTIPLSMEAKIFLNLLDYTYGFNLEI